MTTSGNWVIEDVAIQFQVATMTVDGYPFELMLNRSFPGPDVQAELDWLWTIRLRSVENDERGRPAPEERETLTALAKAVLREVVASREIHVLGTSLHRGNHEVMFYARAEDQVEIGATLAGIPETIEDRAGRLLGFSGAPDPGWEKARTYYLAFKGQPSARVPS